MMFVTNDIFKQFAIGCVADLGKILLVSGQITIAFESINNNYQRLTLAKRGRKLTFSK